MCISLKNVRFSAQWQIRKSQHGTLFLGETREKTNHTKHTRKYSWEFAQINRMSSYWILSVVLIISSLNIIVELGKNNGCRTGKIRMASIWGKSKKLRLINNNNNKKDEIASQRCQENSERNLLAVENKSLSKPIDLEIPAPYAFGSQESKVR